MSLIKPPIQALLSAWFVREAKHFHSFYYHLNHNEKFSDIFVLDNIKTWAKCYKDFLSQTNAFLQAVNATNLHQLKIPSEVLTILNKFQKAKNLNRALPNIEILLRQYFLNNFELEEENNDEQAAIEYWKEFMNTQLIFIFKIFIPCIINFKTSPQILYRNTLKKGDLNAFRLLLQIDKNIIRIPEIAKIWEKENRNPSSRKFQRLVKGVAQKPLKTLSIGSIKTIIATAIEALFEFTGHKISRSEIRKLFDSYMLDTEENMYCDIDLPQTLDAFSRNINRERKRWEEAFELSE